ncbi:MerR family transcriptional regulator [Nocardia colli]|uniref:MerR family transcriptional regulator n=1 Tax=Nocardia colli TaxID=2545717 RepID=A0A5N0EM92_9NOCA|nr:chaperone modulator CbpM [Nocardia colli]KAA8888531.1 MerR family transcriptional regulator [Nocardia colli]
MSAPTRRYVIVRQAGLRLDEFSRRCGLHPSLVRRLVALGLLDGAREGTDLRFEPSAVAVVARIQRLRSGLGLNYAAIGLVLDLLDRIEELEADPRRRTSRWTPAS